MPRVDKESETLTKNYSSQIYQTTNPGTILQTRISREAKYETFIIAEPIVEILTRVTLPPLSPANHDVE